MKKSYNCEKLEKVLRFLPDKIQYCCACAEGLSFQIKNVDEIKLNDIERKRKQYIKRLKSGIIPTQCTGCIDIKEIENQRLSFIKDLFIPKKKISHIIFDHFKQCDCKCIYCTQKILYPEITQNYQALPILRQLYEKQLLSEENLVFEFQGGNISKLNEFEELIEEIEKHNCSEIYFLTNGIVYLPTIERIAKKVKTYVCISLDAGTKEIFKKIKNVDAFEQATENIKNLAKKSNINLKLKYILIKDVNDNLQEVEKFLEFAKSLSKIDSIMFEIDYRDTCINKEKSSSIPKYYAQLIEFAENFCKDNNLNFWISDFSKSFLK